MKRRIAALAALAVLGASLAAWHSLGDEPAITPAMAPAIPIAAVAAVRANVPVYLRGLGSVQAFNSITVTARVDGELQEVAFTEGQRIAAGALLAQIDPRPFQAQLEQAQAKKAQDEAQLANARRDLARFSELATRQFASRQSLDTQRALVEQFEATLKGDQAAINNAQVQLGYTRITSPIAGRTGMRLIDQGNIVRASDVRGVVVITQVQPISVVFTVPEENLRAITRAMAEGWLPVQVVSRDEKEVLAEGTLALVDNTINSTTGTARLKATFPNADDALWPGQFVNMRLRLRTEENVVTVPSAAVQRGAEGFYAYVVTHDDTVELRALTLAEMNNENSVIETGIIEGERVVTAGHYRLQPGARVEVGIAEARSAPDRGAGS